MFFMLVCLNIPPTRRAFDLLSIFGCSKDNFINWVDDMDISDGEHSDELESMSDGSDSD
jgi:hypothetical protein